MKLYDLVKITLINYPQTRNSDRELIWQVYKHLGAVEYTMMLYEHEEVIRRSSFLSSKIPSVESIRRARQKIQEKHKELQATNPSVRAKRKQKQNTKGTFIYREEI